MSKWEQTSIGDFIDFNPRESIAKNSIAKKIAMEKLTPWERKIRGYEYVKYSNGPKFRNGDTLVAKITPCLENGKTAQVNILAQDEVAFGSSEFIVLRENKESVNDFIFYFAKSPVFRDRAISCMEGTSGRKRVNESALKRQQIVVPEKHTQRKIASILSSLDDKIELNNRISAELEMMAKTIYDYWFVQFDFPDANGKPYKSSRGKMIYNNILKREIPEGWDVKDFNFFQMYQPQTISEKEMVVDGKYFVFGANGIVGKYNSYNHEDNEIVITCRGNSCGNIIRTLPKSWITGNAMVIKSNLAYVGKEFIYQMLHWVGLKKVITGSGQPQITRNNLQELVFILPPKPILEKYNELTSSLIENINAIFSQNQCLASIREWLLPLLMNGQVTIKDQVKAENKCIEALQTPRTIPVDAHILGGHIVNKLHNTTGMGRTKLQKALHLVEYHCELSLNSQSMQFAAGPHDQELMNHIDHKFRNFGHVKKEKKVVNGRTQYKYTPTTKIVEVEQAYERFDPEKREKIDNLLDKLAKMDLGGAEILSTLYAVWNNRLIRQEPITDDLLVADFYAWSDHKSEFSKSRVRNCLGYMRKENIIPAGRGQYIDKIERDKNI